MWVLPLSLCHRFTCFLICTVVIHKVKFSDPPQCLKMPEVRIAEEVEFGTFSTSRNRQIKTIFSVLFHLNPHRPCVELILSETHGSKK